MLQDRERQADIRRSAHVRAERLLHHLALGALKPAGATDDRAVRDHANLSKTRFEAFRPDRIPVAVELKHLRGVEPHVLGGEVAGEEALAAPNADGARLRRIAEPRALLERAAWEDRAIDDECRAAIRTGRLGVQ